MGLSIIRISKKLSMPDHCKMDTVPHKNSSFRYLPSSYFELNFNILKIRPHHRVPTLSSNP
jgi:hypothetical protein